MINMENAPCEPDDLNIDSTLGKLDLVLEKEIKMQGK